MKTIEADWTGAHLISAIRERTEDSIYRSGQAARAMEAENAKAARREAVRELHGQMKTAKQIGRELGVACSTVYKDLIFLGLHTHNSRAMGGEK